MAAVAGAAAGTEVRGHWSGHVWGVNVLRHSSEYDLADYIVGIVVAVSAGGKEPCQA